ncbi:MAG: redoxin family protein, partial [Thiogranum sp.]
MPRFVRYLAPLFAFLALAGLLFKGLSLDPRKVPSPLIDKPAPTFSLTRLKQPEATLGSADLKGKVTLFNVWATWCVACRSEHPVLMQLAESGKVAIYG